MRVAQDRLERLVERHGYQMVETPVIEQPELFVRKSGGERLAQLYTFTYRGRELALRPEHTASIVRMYVDQFQSEPLPIRLAYAGPVFRYENPQAGRSRQFTEFGCELIGTNGLVADVETINLALDCLAELGVSRPHLVLGHIGIIIGFLEGLQLDQLAQDWLLWRMERLQRGEEHPSATPSYLVNAPATADGDDALNSALDGLDQQAIVRLLHQSGVNFTNGSRTPEEIVAGLFAKRRRGYDQERLANALAFVSRLTQLTGPPEATLGPLRELAASQGLDTAPLDEIEQIVSLLGTTRHDPPDITINIGMGRGLRYYTGILFEVYPDRSSDRQLCGGGRYDDLATNLGARHPVPAAGFSLGLERVAETTSTVPAEPEPPSILVLPSEDSAQAIQWATRLRANGWLATVEPRSRNEAASKRWAERRNYQAVGQVAGDQLRVTRLADGAALTFASPPAPGEVLA